MRPYVGPHADDLDPLGNQGIFDGWPYWTLRSVVRELAVSTAEVNKAGVLHRDIKGGNVMASESLLC